MDKHLLPLRTIILFISFSHLVNIYGKRSRKLESNFCCFLEWKIKCFSLSHQQLLEQFFICHCVGFSMCKESEKKKSEKYLCTMGIGEKNEEEKIYYRVKTKKEKILWSAWKFCYIYGIEIKSTSLHYAYMENVEVYIFETSKNCAKWNPPYSFVFFFLFRTDVNARTPTKWREFFSFFFFWKNRKWKQFFE